MEISVFVFGFIGLLLILLGGIVGGASCSHKSYPRVFHIVMKVLYVAINLIALYFLAMPAFGKILLK